MVTNEFNGMIYFGWPYPPWCGIIYEVERSATGSAKAVVLPNGTVLRLTINHNQLKIEDVSRTWYGCRLYDAVQVFDTHDDPQHYDEDWEVLFWKINAAAAVNALFTIYLPEDEYQRLSVNNEAVLEEMKQCSMSKRAASLVHLEKDYLGDGPALCLYRTGGCP